MIKGLWHDPVWSKVIAAAIISAPVAIWGARKGLLATGWGFLIGTSVVPHWALGLFAIITAVLLLQRRAGAKPPLRRVPVSSAKGLHPLKPILHNVGVGAIPYTFYEWKTLYIVGIENAQKADDITARNVTAALKYRHADGRDSFRIEKAGWAIAISHGGQFEDSGHFAVAPDLAPEEMQKLIVGIATQSGESRVAAFTETAINLGRELKFGGWTVDVTIVADNCDPLEFTVNFSVDKNKTLYGFAIQAP